MADIVARLRGSKLNDSAGDDLDQLLEEAAREIERLHAVLVRAYDGMLNHHLNTQQENDDITNEIGAVIPEHDRMEVAFGPTYDGMTET